MSVLTIMFEFLKVTGGQMEDLVNFTVFNTRKGIFAVCLGVFVLLTTFTLNGGSVFLERFCS